MKKKKIIYGLFRFKYIKACMISIILFIISAILAFQLQGNWSSFMSSISTGILTGFIFFVISGLKSYDIEKCIDTANMCTFCDGRLHETILMLENILNKPTFKLGELNELTHKLHECDVFYSYVTKNFKKDIYKEHLRLLKSYQSELSKYIDNTYSINKNEESHQQVIDALEKLNKLVYSMISDITAVKINSQLTENELKLMKI